MIKKALILSTASLLLAGAAHADFIAGWDHSQYLGPNVPSIDGINLVTELDANYSDFDPSFGAGAESAAFGTLYLTSNGASANAANFYIPTSSPITVGKSLPVNDVPEIDVPFDSFSVLSTEGQANQTAVSMIVQESLSVVYAADLSSVGLVGNGYSFDFAGKSLSGTQTVGIEASADGVNFTPVGQVQLAENEGTFNVDFGGLLDGSATAFVRMNFTVGGNGTEPVIDNVGISAAEVVPEPGTLLLVSAGLAGLAYTSRRRRA